VILNAVRGVGGSVCAEVLEQLQAAKEQLGRIQRYKSIRQCDAGVVLLS
jgi:hypothetical protein